MRSGDLITVFASVQYRDEAPVAEPNLRDLALFRESVIASVRSHAFPKSAYLITTLPYRPTYGANKKTRSAFHAGNELSGYPMGYTETRPDDKKYWLDLRPCGRSNCSCIRHHCHTVCRNRLRQMVEYRIESSTGRLFPYRLGRTTLSGAGTHLRQKLHSPCSGQNGIGKSQQRKLSPIIGALLYPKPIPSYTPYTEYHDFNGTTGRRTPTTASPA